MEPQMQLNSLPSPRPAAAGRARLALAALLALAVVGGAAFWLTRDEDSKKELGGKTEEALRSIGLEPLIDAGRKLFAPAPPPPPVHTVGTAAPGVAANGTLIQGTVPEFPDPAAREGETEMPGLAPVQREDSVVRVEFLRDLAGWMVARHKSAPPGGKGSAGIGVRSANMRYGSSLRGMGQTGGGDMPSARAAVLRYAFNPGMLEALYSVYADRFVDEVAQAALAPEAGKALSEAQLDELYRSYSGFFNDLAGVCTGIAELPDLKNRTEQVNAVGRQNIALHAQVMETVFALDEAREKDDKGGIGKLEAKLADLDARYRAGLQAHSAARAALISAIRKGGAGAHMDDDSVLFVSLWMERRMERQADVPDTARTASELLKDLAGRFERAAARAPLPAGAP